MNNHPLDHVIRIPTVEGCAYIDPTDISSINDIDGATDVITESGMQKVMAIITTKQTIRLAVVMTADQAFKWIADEALKKLKVSKNEG